jgi:NAD-dependent deacetylase
MPIRQTDRQQPFTTRMSRIESIVILTGAGISAESGLPTFRDKDGLWEGHRVEDVACPEAFRRDPVLVHRFYNLRRAALRAVEPNAAHLALARLQRALPGPGAVAIITQNVDDLHERAGCAGVIHMHGELRQARCTCCGCGTEWDGDLETTTPCPSCGRAGGMRPDIVWFGEIPYQMERIESLLLRATVFAAIGTSGLVQPAAGFVSLAKILGARTVEINTAPTMISGSFDEHRTGPATREVPRWVKDVLGEVASE